MFKTIYMRAFTNTPIVRYAHHKGVSLPCVVVSHLEKILCVKKDCLNIRFKFHTFVFFILFFIKFINITIAQVIDPWIYVVGGFCPDPLIRVSSLQKINISTNQLLTIAETPYSTDIAFHPDGRLLGCVGNQIFEIDTSGFTFPALPKKIIAQSVPYAYFTGMTIDKEGLIWLCGHNPTLKKRVVFTYDLKSNEIKEFGYLPWEKGYSDIEWYNGDLYIIGRNNLIVGSNYELMLTKINMSDVSLSEDVLLGHDYESWGLVSLNDECLSYELISTCGTDRFDPRGYYIFNDSLTGYDYIPIDSMCAATGATSRYSWLGSYTPLGIDSVTVRSVHNDCAPPYSLTAHTHKGYYMRPDIEFSLDGMTFQTDSIFTVPDTGLYVIHVRDSFGCYRYSDTVSVGRHDLSSTAVVAEDYCGLASGAAVVYTKPGDMLSQDGQHYVADSLVLRDLVAGKYQYFISNALGCQDTGSFTIGQQAAFTLAASVSPDTCGRGHGSILLMPQGAHGGLSYSADGQGYAYGTEIGGLGQGNYTYYVIDSAGCKVVFSEKVAEIAGPAFSNLQIESPDCSKSNGRLYVTADGQNITYSLNGTTNTTGTFDSLDAGTFVLSISDENQCRSDTTIQLSGKANISISSLKTEDAHCDLSNGMVEIQAADHTGIVTYSTDGVNYTDDNIFTGLSAGQYIAYIRSEDDCISTAAFTIDQTGMPWFERVEVEDVTCSESNGRIGFTASGFQPLTYYLDGIQRADTVISDLQEGIYQLEVKDAFGCDAVKEVEVKNQKEVGWTALGYTAGQCGSGMGTLYFGGSVSGVYYDLPALPKIMMPGDSLRLPYGKYEVRLHNGTCIKDSVITIQGVACPYFIPNTFSPNHDGVNDVFRVEGAAEVAEMRIFDRWGACLYASGRPDAGWDGTFHGAAVTPGVYVYWVKVRLPDGSTEVRKGDVTVVR